MNQISQTESIFGALFFKKETHRQAHKHKKAWKTTKDV